MALSHKKLAQKRHKANLKRKDKKYNAHKRYYAVENNRVVQHEQSNTQFVEDAHNAQLVDSIQL